MKETQGNIFSKKFIEMADAICITTNGFVKKDGTAVMGAGVAKQAKKLFKGIDLNLGTNIKGNGNIVQVIIRYDCNKLYNLNKKIDIVSFPVKHNWWEQADLSLISKSTFELSNLADINNYNVIILPKPGCHNGRRDWKTEVKPIVRVLDDRFYIIDL